MDIKAFREQAHALVEWVADYYENIEEYPVKSQLEPGQVLALLPRQAPEQAESFKAIMQDFNQIIMPGITHWQHPSFFAYFPANTSHASFFAEMLVSALGAQCMSWQTSPAATELEECVMGWLRQLLDLPEDFEGVIQDTASTATLCAVLTAREKKSHYQINKAGFTGTEQFTLYCSTEAHSSIEKAIRIAGFGANSLRKISVDEAGALNVKELRAQIKTDKAGGFQPLCVIAALGTTGTTAIDPIEKIGDLCTEESLWFHIDAAYAGSALILPEQRHLAAGIDKADSFVFNPHKWLFTHFDCSAYFVKDTEALKKTFSILPEYLKTEEGSEVNNYRDWGIALGRRFRALKLWFVMRSFGAEGLRQKLRGHIKLANHVKNWILDHPDFELMAPVTLNLLCFRYRPNGIGCPNKLNQVLLEALNATGKAYFTHTKIGNDYVIRWVIGQTEVEASHVKAAWNLIKKIALVCQKTHSS